MSVMMLSKNIPNKGVEAGTSCKDLSPDSLGMQGEIPGGRNQAITNKTPFNADNEDNVIALRKEYYGNYKL